jgi:hypothetical protein
MDSAGLWGIPEDLLRRSIKDKEIPSRADDQIAHFYRGWEGDPARGDDGPNTLSSAGRLPKRWTTKEGKG